MVHDDHGITFYHTALCSNSISLSVQAGASPNLSPGTGCAPHPNSKKYDLSLTREGQVC